MRQTLRRVVSALALVPTLTLALTLAVPWASAQAQTLTGPRIPTAYFATCGNGQSDQGIPPDPYETFSYDLALQQAGIENFNVVYYTSVLPPESYEVPLSAVAPRIHHGAVLEAILAKAGGGKGDTVASGVGRVWAVDAKGNYIGGFAAEYEFVYAKQKVAPDMAKAAAVKQLTASLDHELTIRGLTQKGEKVFTTDSLYITKNYGISLSALGFIGFIEPKPIVAPGAGSN